MRTARRQLQYHKSVLHTLKDTSARLLEFDALRELVRGYTVSDLGRDRVEALAPSTDLAWIRTQQQLTAAIREFRRARGSFNFSGLLDISKILEKSRISGAALGAEEIFSVITVVDRGMEWREIAFHPPQGIKGDWAGIRELSSGVADLSPLLKAIRGKILPDGTLDDRASPQLAGIRREIEKQRRTIQDSLRGYLRRLSEGGTAQDELVTVRGERFVIPVKVEQKRRVQGVVHGTSSSGQTVFIEPLETIEQNNELVRLLEEEQGEIRRILLEMTERIGEQAVQIAAAQEVLAELELQFAKAKFADDYNCVAPQLGSRGRDFILGEARHPLLERNLRLQKAEAVPVSLELEGERRQLIITGPNTGGKTVTLKIIGLFVLMAQSGIPVPASRMEMPVFDAVLADIGDYQSIEQNLSTFSAHVTHIDFISRIATSQSLILLDELGSATDPEEGAALAVAIADHFLKIGCITAISTHHTSLKVFGANSPGVLNAAVGLDEASLKPTYQLKTGVPGASAGISTAQRLGLNPEIVSSARARLGTQARDVGQFLDQLHEQLKTAEWERLRLKTKEDELNRERTRLATEGKRLQQEIVRELEKKLESLLRDF